MNIQAAPDPGDEFFNIGALPSPFKQRMLKLQVGEVIRVSEFRSYGAVCNILTRIRRDAKLDLRSRRMEDGSVLIKRLA